jgi:hypothetical protein
MEAETGDGGLEKASRLGRSLLTMRVALNSFPTMVKAPMGVVKLGEDRHSVGSVREGLRRCGDNGGAELGFGAQKTCNRGDGWILFIVRGVVEG